MAVLMFHKDVFIPRCVQSPCFSGELRYSRHALESAKARSRGNLWLPRVLPVSQASLVEVEWDEFAQAVHKQVWRLPYDDIRDMVMPVLATGLVTTVWFNRRDDLHNTLKRERYVTPQSWQQHMH